MPTISELQTRLDKLRSARASGVRSLEHGDTKSEFKADAEMASAIADIERQIAVASGSPVRTIYITGSKGV
jgi:hypothetical protein